jgi:hypothetical protein
VGQAAPAGPGGVAGQVRAWYDGGVLEVFGPAGPAAAVICDRDGVYGRLDVEVSGAPKEQASLAVWACGDAEG